MTPLDALMLFGILFPSGCVTAAFVVAFAPEKRARYFVLACGIIAISCMIAMMVKNWR